MNTLKNQIDSLYITCMNCTNTEKECKGVLKDFKKGIPPRGFLFMSAPIKVLIVSKNPGHPLKGEKQKYIGKIGSELYQAYRNHQIEVYYNLKHSTDRSLTFHKNMFKYASFFFDIPDADPKNIDIGNCKNIDKIYQHVAHTNLVKCSTKGESAHLHYSTMEECYNKYFKSELKLLKPKVLLALGREVEKFLNDKKPEHNLPVIYIKHPSYPLPKEYKDRILSEIKKRITKYL